jgi:hypothetical protein
LAFDAGECQFLHLVLFLKTGFTLLSARRPVSAGRRAHARSDGGDDVGRDNHLIFIEGGGSSSKP